ncbi:MAG: right-handed parallel beta-helix repeat-containing protein [Pirellulales bacterium]
MTLFRRWLPLSLFGWLSAATLAGSLAAQEAPAPASSPKRLIVDRDMTLDPGGSYGSIVITASNVTLDGAGVQLIGPGKTGDPKSFQGIAVRGEGVSNVTIRNLRASGWETGIVVRDGRGWTIEGCDLSDNFHDPEFGWGENGRRGGIVLERVQKSTIRRCRANRVWDACVLVDSHENRIELNDFSRTSNTCLKLWASSRNLVVDNNLSYGIRIKAGEVHARDSTSVLIESGSNANRFLGNDCTHGGDGIFIRVLNGWCSVGNYFERNDCSYANNNGFECWAPENTFVRNKANHCSYGFWMGGSDRSVLVDNEASFNGQPDGPHNSPHLPDRGHAGIVFMFGPSSHTVARGNVCRDNQGAGIAVIGDQGSKGQKWKAFHWIIEQNVLERNRWGVFLEYADWIDLRGNAYRENAIADVHQSAGATRISRTGDERPVPRILDAPQVLLEGPNSVVVGQEATWTAKAVRGEQRDSIKAVFRWDLGAGESETSASALESTATKTFLAPGFHRIGVTGSDGQLSGMAWRDLYVVDAGEDRATEGGAGDWTWIDELKPASKVEFRDDAEIHLAGRSSVYARAAPYNGGRVHFVYPRERSLGAKVGPGSRLVFWVKAQNPNLPGFQDVNPLVTLSDSQSRRRRLKPKTDLLGQPTYNEAREGWRRIVVPLAGDATWEATGEQLQVVDQIQLGFDSWGGDPLDLWIDGLQFQTTP